MVQTLLEDLPGMFEGTSITHSGLGAALTMAEKLLVSMYTFIEGKMLILSIEYHVLMRDQYMYSFHSQDFIFGGLESLEWWNEL